MNRQLTLYSRQGCCLCEEMKAIIQVAAVRQRFSLEEIDVDGCAQLQEQYGSEVPVLFIDGRKAFKYRVTQAALERRLKVRGLGILGKFRTAINK